MAEDTDPEDKVVDASPRRRQEAREKGQVALSAEIVVAVLLVGWLATLCVGAGPVAASLASGIARTAESLGTAARSDLSPQEAALLLGATAVPVAKAVLVLILPMFALGWLISYGQIGFAMTPKAVGL